VEEEVRDQAPYIDSPVPLTFRLGTNLFIKSNFDVINQINMRRRVPCVFTPSRWPNLALFATIYPFRSEQNPSRVLVAMRGIALPSNLSLDLYLNAAKLA
jgi:hypothetical protein